MSYVVLICNGNPRSYSGGHCYFDSFSTRPEAVENAKTHDCVFEDSCAEIKEFPGIPAGLSGHIKCVCDQLPEEHQPCESCSVDWQK